MFVKSFKGKLLNEHIIYEIYNGRFLRTYAIQKFYTVLTLNYHCAWSLFSLKERTMPKTHGVIKYTA